MSPFLDPTLPVSDRFPGLRRLRQTLLCFFWISPGAAAALIIWLAASFVLRVYLHFFNSYSATYGSLGAVIILMLWLYLSGFALLLGGEVNSVIAHAEIEKAKQEEKDQQRARDFQKDLQAA